jgi:hypothetical protein
MVTLKASSQSISQLAFRSWSNTHLIDFLFLGNPWVRPKKEKTFPWPPGTTKKVAKHQIVLYTSYHMCHTLRCLSDSCFYAVETVNFFSTFHLVPFVAICYLGLTSVVIRIYVIHSMECNAVECLIRPIEWENRKMRKWSRTMWSAISTKVKKRSVTSRNTNVDPQWLFSVVHRLSHVTYVTMFVQFSILCNLEQSTFPSCVFRCKSIFWIPFDWKVGLLRMYVVHSMTCGAKEVLSHPPERESRRLKLMGFGAPSINSKTWKTVSVTSRNANADPQWLHDVLRWL